MRLQLVNSEMHRYEELLSSESIGQYMHKNIIGHYDYERVLHKKAQRVYLVLLCGQHQRCISSTAFRRRATPRFRYAPSATRPRTTIE